jgi:hypothetical protein
MTENRLAAALIFTGLPLFVDAETGHGYERPREEWPQAGLQQRRRHGSGRHVNRLQSIDNNFQEMCKFGVSKVVAEAVA